MKGFEWVLESNSYKFNLKVTVTANDLEEAISKGKEYVELTLATNIERCQGKLLSYLQMGDPFIKEVMTNSIESEVSLIEQWGRELKATKRGGRSWDLDTTNPFIETTPPLYSN
jgi:hypothetical protein